MNKTKGKVVSVNESLVGAKIINGAVINGEVAYIRIDGNKRLKAEVIDVKIGGIVYFQVFEEDCSKVNLEYYYVY